MTAARRIAKPDLDMSAALDELQEIDRGDLDNAVEAAESCERECDLAQNLYDAAKAARQLATEYEALAKRVIVPE